MNHTDITIRIRYPWSGEDFGWLEDEIDWALEGAQIEYEDWKVINHGEIKE